MSREGNGGGGGGVCNARCMISKKPLLFFLCLSCPCPCPLSCVFLSHPLSPLLVFLIPPNSLLYLPSLFSFLSLLFTLILSCIFLVTPLWSSSTSSLPRAFSAFSHSLFLLKLILSCILPPLFGHHPHPLSLELSAFSPPPPPPPPPSLSLFCAHTHLYQRCWYTGNIPHKTAATWTGRVSLSLKHSYQRCYCTGNIPHKTATVTSDRATPRHLTALSQLLSLAALLSSFSLRILILSDQ